MKPGPETRPLPSRSVTVPPPRANDSKVFFAKLTEVPVVRRNRYSAAGEPMVSVTVAGSESTLPSLAT